MSQFITLSRVQFEIGLNEIKNKLPNGDLGFIKATTPEKVGEYVYEVDTKYPDIQLKIYSTISIRTNKSRDIGSDAIRCVAVYKGTEIEIFRGTSHTKRIETWKKNLQEKIEGLICNSSSIPKCPKCGRLMAQRKGPYGVFWGCINYPRCKEIKRINKK